MKKVVMDVGCGTSLNITKHVDIAPTSGTWIIGVDWDPYFCRQSKEKAKEYGLNAEYVRCDAAYLPFRDETFDAVYMLDTIRCLKGHPLPLFVKEAYKKLKQGGELCITGLDKVSYMGRNLPIFKSLSLPFNRTTYVPTNASSPFLSEEPSWTEVDIEKKYRCVGVFRETMVSELLWRCGIEPESKWDIKKEGDYTYYFYKILASKSR